MAELAKLLHINSETAKIYSSTSDIASGKYIQVEVDGATCYVAIGDTTDANATSGRVSKDDTTYAILSTAFTYPKYINTTLTPVEWLGTASPVGSGGTYATTLKESTSGDIVAAATISSGDGTTWTAHVIVDVSSDNPATVKVSCNYGTYTSSLSTNSSGKHQYSFTIPSVYISSSGQPKYLSGYFKLIPVTN